jgi:Ni,Fe-hydrogenase I large subunit
MSKKKHDPVKALMKAFHDEVNDPELQENYNRFTKDLQRYKDKHNEIVPIINENLEKLRILKAAVLAQAISGVLAPHAVEKITGLEKENEDLIKNIEFYQDKIKETADLIEKYEDWSGRKLFIWWQAIRAVDPETAAWMEWKKTYEGKII